MRSFPGMWKLLFFLVLGGFILFAIFRAPAFLKASAVGDIYTQTEKPDIISFPSGSGGGDSLKWNNPFTVSQTSENVKAYIYADTPDTHSFRLKIFEAQDDPIVTVCTSAAYFDLDIDDVTEIELTNADSSGSCQLEEDQEYYFRPATDQASITQEIRGVDRAGTTTDDIFVILTGEPSTAATTTQIISLIEDKETLATTTAIVEATYFMTADDEPRYTRISFDFWNIDTNQKWTDYELGLQTEVETSAFGGVGGHFAVFPPGMYLVIVGFVADSEYWGYPPFEDPNCVFNPFGDPNIEGEQCVPNNVIHYSKSFEFVVGSTIYGTYQDGTLVTPLMDEFPIDCSLETGLDFLVCKVGEYLHTLGTFIKDVLLNVLGLGQSVLSNAFENLRQNFFKRAPWGYGLRIYEIICGEFVFSQFSCTGTASSTLPSFLVTAPSWVEERTGASLGSGIDFSPFQETHFSFIQTSLEEQEVENVATTTDPWQAFLSKWTLFWNLMFGIFLLYIVFGVEFTVEDYKEERETYKGL